LFHRKRGSKEFRFAPKTHIRVGEQKKQEKNPQKMNEKFNSFITEHQPILLVPLNLNLG
jgi:hypothetical protein